MSDEKDDPKMSSIFDGAEPPEEGAQIIDDAPLEDGKPEAKVTDAGHVTVTAELDEEDNLYDHAPEQEAMMEAKKATGTAPPDLPEDAAIPAQNPAMMVNPTEGVKEEVERRFRAEFGDRKVEVTAEEREAFVRSALHDEAMVFKIPLEATGSVVTVVTPPDSFTTAASAMANQWGRDGHISADSDLEWLLAFQQLHVWYQVRAVDGKPTSWASWWDEDHDLKEIREVMSDPSALEDVTQMNPVRWRMLLEAVRVAELKYKICLENWHNRTFFTTAGTA